MKQDLSNAVLNVQNGLNGQIFVYEDFFKFSHVTQENIIADIILPLLYEFKKVNISIGYKS